MSSLLEKSEGLILGKFKNGTVVVQPEESKISNRNVFLVGGPGSFKTQSYVLPVSYTHLTLPTILLV